MVHSATSGPSRGTAPERADGDDLSVEAVATRHGDASRAIGLRSLARIERLRRLALESRVAELRRDLERARDRRAAVIEHYEGVIEDYQAVIDERGVDDERAAAWLRR